MKESVVAYRERLESICKLVKEEKYASCFNVARNLTNFSWALELKDEVFISEVLESLFDQMNLLTSNYKIPFEQREDLMKKLSNNMEKLTLLYAEKNPSKLYDCLKNLRYSATFHQLYVWQECPKLLEQRYAR